MHLITTKDDDPYARRISEYRGAYSMLQKQKLKSSIIPYPWGWRLGPPTFSTLIQKDHRIHRSPSSSCSSNMLLEADCTLSIVVLCTRNTLLAVYTARLDWCWRLIDATDMATDRQKKSARKHFWGATILSTYSCRRLIRLYHFIAACGAKSGAQSSLRKGTCLVYIGQTA